MNANRQKGLYTVEFAIIGLLAMVVLFGAIEMGRMLFVANTLGEATRRGARVAAVCPINDPAIANTTIFNTGSATIANNMTTGNVVVEYLDEDGIVVPNPSVSTAEYVRVRYVRVRIQGFQHTMFIPGMNINFTMPEYPSTLPRESLGVPREGVVAAC